MTTPALERDTAVAPEPCTLRERKKQQTRQAIHGRRSTASSRTDSTG